MGDLAGAAGAACAKAPAGSQAKSNAAQSGARRGIRLCRGVRVMSFECAGAVRRIRSLLRPSFGGKVPGMQRATTKAKALHLRCRRANRLRIGSESAQNRLRIGSESAHISSVSAQNQLTVEPMPPAMKELGLTENIAPGFEALLNDVLTKLEMFNYARYNLTRNLTEAWIEAGRPR
jgi:hypothetical protein